MLPRRYYILLLMLTITISIKAVWINNAESEFTQPDGKHITYFITGDEFHHWGHDEQGYIMQEDTKTGYLCWATPQNDELVSTGYPVHLHDPKAIGLTPNDNISEQAYADRRDLREQLTRDTGEPTRAITIGDVINLVIFIKCSDYSEFPNDYNFFNSRLNATLGNASSLKQYYLTTSYGQLNVHSPIYPLPNGTAIASYTAPYTFNEVYNSGGNGSALWWSVLKGAVDYVASSVTETAAQLDTDGNGTIDNVFFIFRGSSNSNQTILWSHRFVYGANSPGTPAAYIGTKRLYDYVLVMENHAIQNTNSYGVGVFCHEYGHTLGAPDNYTYGTIKPIQNWDIMADTSNPPQAHTSYTASKYYNWIQPQFLVASGTYTLTVFPDNDTGSYLKIPSPYDNSQYFMVENRKKTASGSPIDSQIPASGLLIYRCATGISGSGAGSSTRAFEIYAYRPGGTITVNGTIATAHYGVSGRSAINDNTSPSSFIYTTPVSQNTNTSRTGGLDISGISLNSSTNIVTLTVNLHNEPENVDSSSNGNSATITWDAPSLWATRVTPAGYNVYRNGTQINTNTIPSNTRTFTDTNPINGNNSYTVTTLYNSSTHFNGESAHSTASSQFIQLWDSPGNVSATNNLSHITLSWTAVNQPSVTLLGYNIYRNDELIEETVDALTYNDTTIQFYSTYTYHITALYNVGESVPSATATATTASPDPPENLTAENNTSYITLAWDAPDNDGLTLSGYYVYRNNTRITAEPVEDTTYDDHTILLSTRYTYHVTAIYELGETTASETAVITTSSPNPPQNLSATAHNGYITLQWEPPAENTISVTLEGYIVQRNGTPLTQTISETTYQNIGTTTSATYIYTVIAVYDIGNSPASASATATALEPYPPQNLIINNRPGSIVLRWELPEDSPNNETLTSYRIYRKRSDLSTNPQSIATISAVNLQYTETGASIGYTYTYHVVAIYNSTVLSPASNTQTITALHADAWPPPSELTATPGYFSILLAWTEPTITANTAPLDGYIVYRDGEAYSEIIETLQYEDEDVIAEQPYTYYVVASYSSTGGLSESTNSVTSSALTIPLPPPLDLISTSGYEQITLTWTAPDNDTDISTLAGYIVYKDEDPITRVIEDTEYIDNDVEYPTEYIYYVVAVYSSPEGMSEPSDSITASPLHPPVFNPPTALLADADDEIVRLSWTAPAVVEHSATLEGYIVYRDDVQIATPTDPVYEDANVVNDTQYTYFVVATYIDPTGVSVPSETVTARPVSDTDDTLVFTATALHANYPNPFNPETTISFSLQFAENVQINIYNAKGQLVKNLVDAHKPAGLHRVTWNGKDSLENPVSSGIYFYRMTTGEYTSMRKMLLLK